jgi:penicillin-binding protein 2
MDHETFERRLVVLFTAVVALLAVLSVRLWQVQVVQGDYFARLADENRLRVTSVAAPRGLIIDHAGRPLVVNRPAFTVALMPTEMARPDEEIPRVARLLSMDPAEIRQRLAAGRERPFEPVRLRRDVPKDVIAAIEESRMDLPGVLIEIEPVRDYLYRELGAHMLGYLGEISDADLRRLRADGYESGDLIGKAGVERVYDRYLRGRSGELQAEVDAMGRLSRTLRTIPAVPGDTLVLGIDLPMQQAAEAALGNRLGAVVAMDPQTGAVEAFVSHPAFDPDLFSTGIHARDWNALLHDPRQPLIDRAAQAGYPTGSVFKIVTATAALQLGLVNADTGFYDPGYYNLNGRIFHDNANEAFGHLSFMQAIAVSSNVVFWTIGRAVGPEHISEYAHLYGLGSRTGVDLPDEIAGVVPDPAWKRRVYHQPWYGGDTLNTAVGQGYVLVTPIQAARMVAAVANGGTLVTPHIAVEIRAPTGQVIERIAPPPAGRVPLGPQTLATLRAGLAAVVTRGTATSIQIPGLAVAGKTGTAESGHGKPYAWFVGYAPADDPKLVVVAMVENAGYGAEFAAPIVQRVLEVAFGLTPTAQPGDPKP